jgi:hypothetical protein
MEATTISNTNTTKVKNATTSSRKKSASKSDDSEKITEKMEGGIMVRRYKGMKVDVE